MPHVEINVPAPAFALPDKEGRPVALGDYAGQWVLLVLNRGFA